MPSIPLRSLDFNYTGATHIPPPEMNVPTAAAASARARALEGNANIDPTADFWPESTGTRVHFLIQQLHDVGFGF
jgi:hypothetical protein